jgi:hypothetical protein
MRIRSIAISWETAEKIIAKHGVTPAEVREAAERAQPFRGPNSRQGGRTYILRGETYAGRPLLILVRYAGHGVAKLITARHDDTR